MGMAGGGVGASSDPSSLLLMFAIVREKRKPRPVFCKCLLLPLLLGTIDSKMESGVTFCRQQPKLRHSK